MARRHSRKADDGFNGLRIFSVLVVMVLLGTPLSLPVSTWIAHRFIHFVTPQVEQAAQQKTSAPR